VIRGPVAIASGGGGQETPEGTFRVYLKDKDHKSNEFMMPNGQPAPMPDSVFWGPGGIAFHSGDPNKASAGCVHLSPADAAAWFASLQMGDEVQVHGNGTPGDNNNTPADDNSGDDGGDSGDDGGDSGN